MIDCKDCKTNCCKNQYLEITKKEYEVLKRKGKVLKPIKDFGDMVLLDVPCPFLNEKGLCGVYEDRPLMCRIYPHTVQAFPELGVLALGVNTSCPQWEKLADETPEMQKVRKDLVYLEAIMIYRGQHWHIDEKAYLAVRKKYIEIAKENGAPKSKKLFYNLMSLFVLAGLMKELSLKREYQRFLE